MPWPSDDDGLELDYTPEALEIVLGELDIPPDELDIPFPEINLDITPEALEIVLWELDIPFIEIDLDISAPPLPGGEQAAPPRKPRGG